MLDELCKSKPKDTELGDMEKLMDNKEIEETLIRMQKDTTQDSVKLQINGQFHGRNSKLDQLGPKYIRAQSVIDANIF